MNNVYFLFVIQKWWMRRDTFSQHNTSFCIFLKCLCCSLIVWHLIEILDLLKKNCNFSGALAYAELGTMNTSSGAEYAYFMDAFGAPPAFLFSWASTLVLKPSQMAIICLSFGKYAVEAFVTECEPPEIVVKMVALLAVGKSLINQIKFDFPQFFFLL